MTAQNVFNYRQEYIQNRNLIAWKFYNPGDLSEQIDIVINFDAKGKRPILKQLSSISVPVAGINDLIEMKRTSGRPQDEHDIKALERLK